MKKIILIALASILLLGGLPVAEPIKAQGTENIASVPMIRGFNHAEGLTRAKQDYSANAMRLQLLPQDRVRYQGKTLEEGMELELRNMEKILKEASEEGIYVIIDLHQPITDNPNWDNGTPHLWANEEHLVRIIEYWKQIVERAAPYRDYIYGYDLLNEPADHLQLPGRNVEWPSWAQAITDAIRELDQTTPIIIEVSPGAIPRAFVENELIYAGVDWPVVYQGEVELLDDDNVIYSVHMYEPHVYTHQGLSSFEQAATSEDWEDKTTYPGMINGNYWNKNELRRALKPVRDFQLKYNVPIYVGEFSAIRWAEGGAQYIQDVIEIFEEYGWGWTYHAYNEAHVWDVEYTEQMTSSAAQQLAKTNELTDRAAVLKAYMAKNIFLPQLEKDGNLLTNGNFLLDSDADGLADNWVSEGSGLLDKSLEWLETPGENAQTVATSEWGGINQEWINVIPGERYLLKADVKLIEGKLMIIGYSIDSNWAKAGEQHLLYADQPDTDFRSVELELTIPSNGVRSSLRFWGDGPSTFALKNVELLHIGPTEANSPPITTISDDSTPELLQFDTTTFGGKTIDRTEYRIVGGDGSWLNVPLEGVALHTERDEIIAYRSIDSAGIVEKGKAVLVERSNVAAASISVSGTNVAYTNQEIAIEGTLHIEEQVFEQDITVYYNRDVMEFDQAWAIGSSAVVKHQQRHPSKGEVRLVLSLADHAEWGEAATFGMRFIAKSVSSEQNEQLNIQMNAVYSENSKEILLEDVVHHVTIKPQVNTNGSGWQQPVTVVSPSESSEDLAISPEEQQQITNILEEMQANTIVPPVKVNGLNKADGDLPYYEGSLSSKELVDGKTSTVVRFDPVTGQLTYMPAQFRVLSDGSTEIVFYSEYNQGIYMVVTTSVVFDDLQDHWAKEAIDMMAAKLIVNGTSKNKFSPNQSISRAEFTAILVRALGLNETSTETVFSDVNEAAWYAGVVQKASQLGFINGFEEGTFRPLESITREQIAVIMSRVLTFLQQPTAASETELDRFADGSTISAWAKSSFAQAVQTKLIQGSPNNKLSPTAYATRAEASVMILRLLQLTDLID